MYRCMTPSSVMADVLIAYRGKTHIIHRRRN